MLSFFSVEEVICHERASYTIAEVAGMCVCVCSLMPSPCRLCSIAADVETDFTPMLMLTVEYSFKVALQKHSAHEPLIRLLQESTDPDVQVSHSSIPLQSRFCNPF